MDRYWTAVLAFWIAIVFFASLKATTEVNLPFIQVLGGGGIAGNPIAGFGRRLGSGATGTAGGGDDPDAVARVLRGTDENV
jgi:hypothetical protein